MGKRSGDELEIINRVNKEEGKGVFKCCDGPPFTSGYPHIGHFYNKVLKDITNRYRVLNGYAISYTPSFDCYGINVEDRALNVSNNLQTRESERQLLGYKESSQQKNLLEGDEQTPINESSSDIIPQYEEYHSKALQIRKECRSFVNKSITAHISQFQRWGIMAHYSQPIRTDGTYIYIYIYIYINRPTL